MSWILAVWVVLNFVLFAVLFVYALQVRRRWAKSSIGFVATSLVLVAGTFLVSSIQRLGIHASRVEVLPPDYEDWFLSRYQFLLSIVGTIAGVYAVTRLRSGMRRLEEGERMVSVLTEAVPFDVNVSDWRLTARELEVLRTIVAGNTSDQQIAEVLYISPATAATHVRNILRKAGMSKRMDLMLVGGAADRKPHDGEGAGR